MNALDPGLVPKRELSLSARSMYDINKDSTDKVLGFCEENKIEVVSRIPFNTKVTEAMIDGKTIIECALEGDVSKEIERIWKGCQESF